MPEYTDAITEQDRLDAVENLTVTFHELVPELGVLDALDGHRILWAESRNLGYYRTFVECSCGGGWWFGDHDGDPSAADRWAAHRATVVRDWLAGVRAEAGAAALEAAAADFARSLTDPAPGCVRGVDETRAWIRARADELRALEPQDTQAASDERRDNRSDEQRPGLTDRPEGEHTEPTGGPPARREFNPKRVTYPWGTTL